MAEEMHMNTTASQPEQAEPETVKELTIEEALQVAMELHRLGQLDNAEVLYGRILEAAPEHPDAMHFLGIALHQRGRNEEAISWIERSIELDPTVAGRHNNLGNVLLELERQEEAAQAYRQAIALSPDHANAYNNLGALLRAQGKVQEARDAYLKAIEVHPEHVDAHNNLGNLYSGQGMIEQALACYSKAITLMPAHPQTRKFLGIAYYTLGQIDKAADVFRQWMADEPDNPVAQHMYAACSGRSVPARASDAYIESTFDGFAASFDAKLGKLSYRAPDLVAGALGQACGAPAARLAVLDAGCGTGLCGPLLAPYASRIVGVDLSSGMLQRAAARAVYDELVKAELQAYLAAHEHAFDAIVSADTLVYFGALDAVLNAASRALKPGGVLIFTVEEAIDGADGYRINPHGRYSHARSYLQRQMALAGLDVEEMAAADLRLEGGKPVAGLVVTGRKAAAAAMKMEH
jgi:predicted TPR repeat methyltransferase